jgi:hypothetical protein
MAVAWFWGVVLPKRHGAMALGKATPLGYGVGVGNWWGVGGKRD